MSLAVPSGNGIFSCLFFLQFFIFSFSYKDSHQKSTCRRPGRRLQGPPFFILVQGFSIKVFMPEIMIVLWFSSVPFSYMDSFLKVLISDTLKTSSKLIQLRMCILVRGFFIKVPRKTIMNLLPGAPGPDPCNLPSVFHQQNKEFAPGSSGAGC